MGPQADKVPVDDVGDGSNVPDVMAVEVCQYLYLCPL